MKTKILLLLICVVLCDVSKAGFVLTVTLTNSGASYPGGFADFSVSSPSYYGGGYWNGLGNNYSSVSPGGQTSFYLAGNGNVGDTYSIIWVSGCPAWYDHRFDSGIAFTGTLFINGNGSSSSPPSSNTNNVTQTTNGSVHLMSFQKRDGSKVTRLIKLKNK